MRKWVFALAAVMTAASELRAGSSDAPDWVETSRKRPMPAYAARADLVILLDEKLVEVSKGDERTRVRTAVKIMTSDGLRSAPSAFQAEQAINESFKLVGGWKIQPDGASTRYDSKSLTQVTSDNRLEFTMAKVNVLAPGDARIGDVVAWEYVLRSSPEAYQQAWGFGNEWPTLLSRFGIKMPADWKMRTKLRNPPAGFSLAPVRDDDGYSTWLMRDLEGIRKEPLSAPLIEDLPFLQLAYGPSANSGDVRNFERWEDVAKWWASIEKAQIVSDASIEKTGDQLAAGAATKLDAIRAVTRFTQGVRYLNVAVGRSIAEPRPAPQVLKNRFGDCEDKAVLTMALLRRIGVVSHPLLVRTSDAGAIDPDFPLLGLFNHAIVAIQAPPGVEFPASVDVEHLGKLIIFDPTDTDTGLGDLSWYLQGARAVLAHESNGGLVTLPVLPPEASSRDAEVMVLFAPGGGINLKARVTYTGQYAASKRSHYKEVNGENRKEELASYLSSHYGKAEVKSLDIKGLETPDDRITVDFEVSMPLPGKDLGSLRMIAAQFLLASRSAVLSEAHRTNPLWIASGFRETERSTIEIPAGWKAAGPLPSIEASSTVGDYSIAASAEGNQVVVKRSLTIRAASIPPAEYAPVKKFFDDVARGDTAAVALEKPSP